MWCEPNRAVETADALILTTWPTALAQGSGEALFITALTRALGSAGSRVALVNPLLVASGYTELTLERLRANLRLAQDPRFTKARWIFASDFDGFALPRRKHQAFIGSARSVFADLIELEQEPFRTLLQTQAFFEGRNLRSADWVVAPSEYAKAKIVDCYAVDPARIRVIPNGVDLDEWDHLARTLSAPAAARRPTLLAVSKLYPRKRIDTLVRATPLIRARFPDVEVRIVGGGFEWDALRRLSRESGAERSITWLGDVADRRNVVAEFERCHVFVHPSVQEAFPNACLESMASARPMIVADAAATPEYVRPSGGGVIVPANDPEALSDAACRLLDDGARRRELGQRGRAFAERMSWQTTARRVLALAAARSPLRN